AWLTRGEAPALYGSTAATSSMCARSNKCVPKETGSAYSSAAMSSMSAADMLGICANSCWVLTRRSGHECAARSDGTPPPGRATVEFTFVTFATTAGTGPACPNPASPARAEHIVDPHHRNRRANQIGLGAIAFAHACSTAAGRRNTGFSSLDTGRAAVIVLRQTAVEPR